MINLEIFGKSEAMTNVAGRLDEHDGVSRVRVVDATPAGPSLAPAAARARTVDPLLDVLHELGVPEADITLMHVEVVGRAVTARGQPSLVWEEGLGAESVREGTIA